MKRIKRIDPEQVRRHARKFFSKIRRVTKRGCWEFKASLPLMYGCFLMNGEQYIASRIAWVLANGRDVPVGLLVCHKCDNSRCVRPDHLYVGTHQNNSHDAMKKRLHSGRR